MPFRGFSPAQAFVDIDIRDGSQRVELRGAGRHRGRENRRQDQPDQSGRQKARHKTQKDIIRVVGLGQRIALLTQ